MNEAKAARYQRLRRRADVVSGAAGIVVLALCGLTPVGAALAAWTRRSVAGATGPWHALAEVVVFVATLAAALEVLALPVVIYLGVSLDRRFKRADKSVGGLVSAQLHAGAVGVIASVVVGIVVHLSVRAAGGWWWLVTGVVLSAALAAVVRGISGLIVRSGAATQLQGSELTARLARVSVEAGVPVAGIFEWCEHSDEGRTASVTGFGRGRRILIAPEVLRDWSHDEIAVVVAHELSHHKHHDLIQAVMLDALMLSSALAVADFGLLLSQGACGWPRRRPGTGCHAGRNGGPISSRWPSPAIVTRSRPRCAGWPRSISPRSGPPRSRAGSSIATRRSMNGWRWRSGGKDGPGS